ncbi:hypothetical protein [Aquisediminimonas profunda]|uniref:hypothetical protein n=1 Tax=Aquisediminimonas profunda TaxID=1550733 RepID=UPI001C62AA71|nr:hypothetical protein [Aquisediminimonas profunda]
MRALASTAISAAILLLVAPAAAETRVASAVRAKDVPTKVESYYRVKWGSLKDFVALYQKNHQPLLEEMRKEGFILDMKSEYAFLHMAGGPRWDMRVTITYRDAAAALNDPAWEDRWADAKARLYKDPGKLATEETLRFSLLEDHWDVVVTDFPE